MEEWVLDGILGQEHWTRRGGRFASVALGQARAKSLTLSDGSFELEQLGLRSGRCAHPGPWPNALSYCPQCGTKLAEPAPLPPPQSWSAPFGNAAGLPVLDPVSDLAPVSGTRREEKLPGASDLAFLVAGAPPYLFAYDLASGMLRVRRESDRQWQELTQLQRADRLPRWAWSACVLPSDHAASHELALATNAGPVLVRLAADAPLATVRPQAADGISDGLGGVACLRGRPVMPVLLASGLGLAWLPEGAPAWRILPAQGGFGANDPAARGRFAVPTVHGGDAFWCSVAGLLSVSVSGDSITAEYRPWPGDRSPVLSIRPLQSDNGTLYQLVRRGDDLPVFRSLTLPDREAEERPFRLCLSSGNAVFVDGKRRRLPWDETGSRAEYSLGDDEFILPLLAFGPRRFLVAVCSGRTTLSSFVESSGIPPAARSCRLAFSPATKTLIPLDRRFDVASAWDLVPFVFRDRLYAYAASTNECWSWALEPAS